ncbi:hypothetical protein EON65_00815 [archaeon]|nr:MAG: hypothetical protein EON65_00815 [archaeon]
MDWRHLLALALAIESTETFIACCDALLDGISLEEVPDLCHAIITHHLIGPNILIRRNSAALLGKVCHLHSASLVEVVSKSLSDGELGRFMDLDTDRIVLEAADTFFFDVISTTVDDICRLYDKSWLDGQNKELKKVLMSSSYSDDTKSAFKYVDVDVSEVISIPPQSKAKRTSNAYKPPSVGINNDVENECALHMMGRTDETWLARLVRFTITKLVSKEWEKREGAALGLHAMLTCLQDTDSIDNRFHILPPFLLADISCIGFASLVKDAIMDFGLDSDHNTSSVGDNLLSPLPLKEILSKLVCRAVYSLNAPDVTAKLLADTCKVMQSDKHWLVTCTGLILACDTFDLFPLSAECVLLVLQVFSSILSVTTHPREVYHYSEKLCRRLSRYCLSHSSQPIPLQGLCCAMSMSELCYLGSEDAVVLCNFVSMVCMSLTLMSSLNPTAEKNDSKESLITSFANLIGALTPSNVDILPVSYLIQVTEDILSVLRLVLNGQCKVGAESLQNLLACLIKPTSILFANPLPHAVDELHSIKELSELRHGARQLSMASNKLGNLLAEIVSQASDVQVTVLTLVNSLLSSFANSSKLFSMNFTSMLATMFSSLSRSGVLSSSLFSSITSSFKSLYASAGLDSAAEIGADNIKKRKFSLIVNDKIFPSPISQSDAASAIAIMTLVKLCSLSILVSCGQPTSELCDFLAGCLNRLQSLNPSLKSWLADYVCFATSLPHKEVSIPQLVNSINAALLLPESKHEVCLALLAPLVRFANLGESCNDLLQSFQHVGQHCLG